MSTVEGYHGPIWQLYAFDKDFPYRYYTNIPFWMKNSICLCDPFPGFQFHDNGHAVCKGCKKFRHYLINQCTGCGEIYLKCFRHVDWCPAPRCQKCWDCIQTAGPCTEHQRKTAWDQVTEPPLVKKPRKFTKEELADFDPLAPIF